MTTKIEGVPDGWELVRIGVPNEGDWVIESDGEHYKANTMFGCVSPIIRKVEPPKPKYRPFANADEFKPHRDRWIRSLENNGCWRPTAYTNECVFYDGLLRYSLLVNSVFDDTGEPCGVKVE